MRRETSEQLSFGDGFIDSSLYELDDELKRVDALLSQKEFLAPFEEVFSETMGRPGTPITREHPESAIFEGQAYSDTQDRAAIPKGEKKAALPMVQDSPTLPMRD